MTFIIIKIIELLTDMLESVSVPMLESIPLYEESHFITLFFDYFYKIEYFIPATQLLLMLSVILTFNLITSMINLATKGWQQMPFT